MQELFNKAEVVLNKARKKNLKLVTAESCTGGMVSVALTAIAGSSDVFERGFVTYSYRSKSEVLGVDADIVQRDGAVSSECVIQMANGALNISNSDLIVSISGIAGPDGGTDDKPVGLVYFGYGGKKIKTQSKKQIFKGNRHEVREQASLVALSIFEQMIDEI